MATRRSDSVYFRVRPHELELIDKAAIEENVTRSEFVRDAAVEAARKRLQPQAA